MAQTPRGIRSVSERILKNGRALIVTSENYDEYDFNSLPDGTLHVDVETGVISVKLAGETTWQPSTLTFDKAEFDTQGKIVNVQNPTLVLARDSEYIEEVYEVGKIDKINGTFIYYIGSRDDNKKRQSICRLNENYYVFQIEQGTYAYARNSLEVYVDGVLLRTAANGGVEEISDTKFALLDSIEEGQIITVRYVKWARVGNPYPRIYINGNEPEDAMIGDLWIDMDSKATVL